MDFLVAAKLRGRSLEAVLEVPPRARAEAFICA
jgi:hypothetical protein